MSMTYPLLQSGGPGGELSEQVVLYAVEQGAATVTMNRPERRNALAADLIEALISALQRAGEDPQVRSVVLTGAGDRAFCAGGDLGGGLQGADGALAAHTQRGRFCALLQAVRTCPKPVIAALNGDALGGGLGLAMACDLIVAEPTARLGTPEVRLGLFPMIIIAELVRNVPRKLLAELVYAGRRLTAQEAQEFHLVNRVSAPGRVLQEAAALSNAIQAHSPTAIGLGKAAWRHAEDLPLEAAEAWLLSRLELLLLTEDAAEGIAAFFQKRPAQWRGR
jgi:enoyl-CoA hydratase/carnithine racemase